jgi:hypothetical protein
VATPSDDPPGLGAGLEHDEPAWTAKDRDQNNGRRPHRSCQLRPDHPVADLSRKQIKRRPVLGGLVNEYERAA